MEEGFRVESLSLVTQRYREAYGLGLRAEDFLKTVVLVDIP